MHVGKSVEGIFWTLQRIALYFPSPTPQSPYDPAPML